MCAEDVEMFSCDVTAGKSSVLFVTRILREKEDRDGDVTEKCDNSRLAKNQNVIVLIQNFEKCWRY